MRGRSVVSILGTVLGTAFGQTADVREVRIAAVGSDTEITILAESEVVARPLLVADPPRLILDVHGASHGLARDRYEGIGRGGIIGMRALRFQPGVVRLVFDLATGVEYDFAAEAGTVRVTFPNEGPPFAPWSTAGEGQATGEGQAAGEGEAIEGADDPRPRSVPDALREAEPRISVVYDSASMLDVLAGFSEFANISIVPNADIASLAVRGIDIRDQPWDTALNAILSAHNLGWHTTEGGILVIDWIENLQARDQLLSETRVIRINYAHADSIAEALQHLSTPNRGQVVAFSGSNTVIVTDAPSVVARMDTIISGLDRRLPQVAIEAKIIFVDRTNVEELGIMYDLKERDGAVVTHGLNERIPAPDPGASPQLIDPDGDGQEEPYFERTDEMLVNVGGDAIAALANANDRPLLPALQILTALAFGEFSLFAFIEVLQSHQLSDVQAAPSIQVVDNAHARIQVGERTPIRVLEAGAQTESARVNVQFEDTGIILDVVPHVTNNNQIRLELMAERSGLKLGLADVGFVFEKQIGETTLLLDDGETAVIGGLTLSEVSRSVSGIPILMNLPLLGPLFRTTRENELRQDLIILVTPHIIDPVPAG